MNRETGEIITEAQAYELNNRFPGIAIPLAIPPTPRQKFRGKIGRNDPCPCGSDKKFKKCCLLTARTR